MSPLSPFEEVELRRPENVVLFSTTVSVTPGWSCATTTIGQSHSTIDPSDIDLERRLSRRTTSAPSDLNDWNPATKEELKCIEDNFPLPTKLGSGTSRKLRWNFFSLYRKLFTLVFLINLAALITFVTQLRKHDNIATYANAATAASANFCLGIMMRNEHVVNLLFRTACSLPISSPLWLRRQAAKVYSYGGVHSGCGVSGAIWYVVFCALIITQYASSRLAETALAITTGLTMTLLVLILVFAHPYMRMRLHDSFEATHRFGGWCAIVCLWTQTIVLVSSTALDEKRSFGSTLIMSPPFWFLVIITCLLVYPWTRLRHRKVRIEHLSKHATRLHFDYTNMETCVGVRLTDAPLVETHGFATIPNYQGELGFSILISNAGDWTNKIITNPPERIWVKGAPTLGVMRVALLFRKVLVIATGSGIGPCLSLLQVYPDYPMRVVWSAKAPLATYGNNIIKSVYRADPNAIIVDTDKTGRGNLLALAYSMLAESDCEAAVVISNPTVTKRVVYGLETRGIPAFGAIFDS